MVRRLAIFLSAVCMLSAEEGMWTFNNFPSGQVRQKYGFAPDAKWLEHVRLSSLRYGNGCSASLVSAGGLVMTNHHCASSCIEALSTKETDYLSNGFYARTPGEEKRCPALEVSQLTGITDVTGRIGEALKGAKPEDYVKVIDSAKARISKECATSENVHCEVVTLYSGGRYDLYQYRRYQDVRLVFAPEKGIAFFGGDPDNFMFPRYNLDVSFLRIYDNGAPLKPADYFRWSGQPARAGTLSFVIGNPGSTDRDYTVSQLEFQRDFELPHLISYFSEMRGLLSQFQTKGPEQKRISENMLMSVENGLKVMKGQQGALVDQEAFQRKREAERGFRARVERDPKLQAAYGSAWPAISGAMREHRASHLLHKYTEGTLGLRSRYYTLAKNLVRAAAELPKPNDARLPEFADAKLPALKADLFSAAPIYDELQVETLTFSLTKLREALGPDAPFVRQLFGKRSPREIATEAVKGTKLRDVAFRKALFEGGKAAVEASGDPMIELARLVDPHARAIRTSYERNIEGVIKKNRESIGRARFAVFGTSLYPDATFTPRINYGSVKGWTENGKQVDPITIIGGAFERHTGRDPFALPASWLRAKDRLALTTAFNMSTNNDVIGGNSGSPIVNQKGEIIGLVFDGNIHSLGGSYWFDESMNRTIAVHGDAILESLNKVYNATRLLDELRPGK